MFQQEFMSLGILFDDDTAAYFEKNSSIWNCSIWASWAKSLLLTAVMNYIQQSKKESCIT